MYFNCYANLNNALSLLIAISKSCENTLFLSCLDSSICIEQLATMLCLNYLTRKESTIKVGTTTTLTQMKYLPSWKASTKSMKNTQLKSMASLISWALSTFQFQITLLLIRRPIIKLLQITLNTVNAIRIPNSYRYLKAIAKSNLKRQSSKKGWLFVSAQGNYLLGTSMFKKFADAHATIKSSIKVLKLITTLAILYWNCKSVTISNTK